MGKVCIGILGASMATANRGVSALGASLIKLVLAALPDALPVLLVTERHPNPFPVSRPPPTLIPVACFRLSPLASPAENPICLLAGIALYRLLPVSAVRCAIGRRLPWIGAVADAACIGDIRGGDSFSDLYGVRKFLLLSIPTLAALRLRRDIVLLPQTYGPFQHAISRAVARHVFSRASVIMARDRQSIGVVHALIGPSDKTRFCPDVAFALDSTADAAAAITPASDSVRVGLNVSGLMYGLRPDRKDRFSLLMDYRAFLRELCCALAVRTDLRLVLIPHTFGRADGQSDLYAILDLLTTLPTSVRDRICLVEREYDQHELKAIIGHCDFFVGSRMHACIAALSQEIPTVAVAYSGKFNGVFESLGVGDWVVDARQLNSAGAIRATLSALERRTKMRAQLRKQTPEIRRQLNDEMHAVLRGAKPGWLPKRRE